MHCWADLSCKHPPSRQTAPAATKLLICTHQHMVSLATHLLRAARGAGPQGMLPQPAQGSPTGHQAASLAVQLAPQNLASAAHRVDSMRPASRSTSSSKPLHTLGCWRPVGCECECARVCHRASRRTQLLEQLACPESQKHAQNEESCGCYGASEAPGREAKHCVSCKLPSLPGPQPRW
jgi:hypothetical protein